MQPFRAQSQLERERLLRQLITELQRPINPAQLGDSFMIRQTARERDKSRADTYRAAAISLTRKVALDGCCIRYTCIMEFRAAIGCLFDMKNSGLAGREIRETKCNSAQCYCHLSAALKLLQCILLLERVSSFP